MRTKQLKKSNKVELVRFICQEKGCQQEICRNADGTTDGNFRCGAHTITYYYKYWYGGQHKFPEKITNIGE